MRAKLLLAIASAFSVATPANADVVSRVMTVTAVYNESCILNPVSGVPFGTLTAQSTSPSSPGSTVTYDAALNLTIWCTIGTQFGVWIPLSSNASGSQRRLYNQVMDKYLNYDIYTDSSFSSLVPVSHTTTGYTGGWGYFETAPTSYKFNARIPAGQALFEGHYEDTITIYVSY